MDYFDLANATKIRLKNYQAKMPKDELVCRARMLPLKTDFPLRTIFLKNDLSAIGIIRRNSPDFRSSILKANFNLKKYAVSYQNSAVSAISVYTQPDFYMGEDSFIPEIKKLIGLPIIQFDFVISSYQIYYAKYLGADAITLISTIMSTEKLQEFITITHSLGMSSIVIAHSSKSVKSAVEAGANIICVDNRNPKTRQVNSDTVFRLRDYVPEDKLFMTRNIIETKDYVDKLREIKVKGIAFGDRFMRCRTKDKILSELSFTIY